MRKRAAQGGSGNVSLTPLRTPFGQLVYAVMRKCFWQRWHSDSGCKAALTRLGIPPSRREVAHSSRGAWRMGRHPVMQEALSNNTLKNLEEIWAYHAIRPRLAGQAPRRLQPPDVENRTFGGVGALTGKVLSGRPDPVKNQHQACTPTAGRRHLRWSRALWVRV